MKRILTPCLIAWALVWLPMEVAAQILIRNATTSTNGTPRLLVDGLIETSWDTSTPGSTASFLLDDPITVEASWVAANTEAWKPAYQLLGSMNYRDWFILAEGLGNRINKPQDPVLNDPAVSQYLRFSSLCDEPVEWELLAGTQAEVQEALENLQPVNWGNLTDPAVILEMIDLAFDWQVANETTRQDGTGWVNGAFYTGVAGLYHATGSDKYRQAILDKGAFANWTLRLRTGSKTFYHADDHCLGQSWLELYMGETTPSPLWILDVKRRLDQVMANPLQGRGDYNWCDALYMSPPNYGRLASITGNDAYQTFIDGQWWDATDFLYDAEFHLYYRDASYFDDREPNGKPVFWSRGNGWVIGGLVRMLQHMPEDWPERPRYITLLKEMAAALAAIQGEDGLWSSSLLYPEKYNMERETSGSAFFTYAIAWGVNEGILDGAIYSTVIAKAWAGLATMLKRDGTIKFIQQIGAGPALNNGLYTDKDYGYGAFILAGTEMMRYYSVDQSAFAQLASRQPQPIPVTAEVDSTTWQSVDGFESGFAWTERKDVGYSGNIVPDPHDAGGSQVLSIFTGNRTPGIYRATTSIPSIGEGTVATVYQRFAYNNPEVDVLLGVSDAGIVDNYNDYESGFRIYFALNQPEARNGDSYVPISGKILQLGTWYEVWMVFDNGSDTYDIYIKGGSNFPEQMLLQSGIAFRNGTKAALSSYAVSYNTDYCEGSFFMDDLHVDTSGVNLTRPEGVRQTVYSPWSDTGRDLANGMKSTVAGDLWDENFPWIYHPGLSGWCYVWPRDSYQGAYWIWSLATADWIWLPLDAGGWYYDYSLNAWKSFEE